MSEENQHIAKAHERIATRNAQVAVNQANTTREELLKRMVHLENIVAVHQATLDDLQRKYNLLLTNRFNGGSTSV